MDVAEVNDDNELQNKKKQKYIYIERDINMGESVSRLLTCCFGREETKDIETNYITSITTQPDIEHDTSNLDYTTDGMYDMRHLKYSTLDDHQLNTRIRYYVLMICNVIHMM